MRTTTEIMMSVQQMVCTECGAEAHASCNCGKPYVPKKQRVADAIAANPEKSSRAIADEIGVDRRLVDRARPGGDNSPPAREGRDGKVYRLPVREIDDESGDTPEQMWERGLRYRAGDAIAAASFSNWRDQYGDYSEFEITSELVTLAEQASEAWENLANHLRSLK